MQQWNNKNIFFLKVLWYLANKKPTTKTHSGDQNREFGNPEKMNYLIKIATNTFIYFHLQKLSIYIISFNLSNYSCIYVLFFYRWRSYFVQENTVNGWGLQSPRLSLNYQSKG